MSDDDLFADDDDDAEGRATDDAIAQAEAERIEAEAAAAAEKEAADKAAAEKASSDQNQAQLAELGLNALKQSWVNDAKAAGLVAADFDGIGLKGIDDDAKAVFLGEAKKSHDDKVAALAAQGFVFQPGAADDAARQAQLDAEDAARAAAWGRSGPGQVATGDETFQKEVEDEVRSGDVMGVIGNLVGKGKLGEFFVTGKRRV